MKYDEFLKIVNPLERPLRTFNCGFSYLETWLKLENEEGAPHGVNLIPDFQRGHVWTEVQQVHYIENVLRRIVDESGLTIRFNCPSWRNDKAKDSDLIDQTVCIDGLQRLTAIRRFIAGELKIFGFDFKDLPQRIILRDLTVVLKLYDFQYERELLQYYIDINNGGTAHSDVEIRRVKGMLEAIDLKKSTGNTQGFINSDRNIGLPVNESIQVPAKPEMACLCSMATTYRHDFGLIEDESQRNMILSEMEKLYYEATGQGYFKRNK